MKTLTKKELLLLSHFRKNARETLTNVSKSTKVPISTIFDKIKKWEQSLIKKHTALLDFEALGYRVRTNIMLKVEKKSRDQLEGYLKRDQRVNSAYRVNNGFDFILEAVFRDVRELQDFIEQLEEKFKITQREVFYIIDDLKREAFLASPARLS